MITNLILLVLYSVLFVVTYPLRALPNATLPAEIINAVSFAGHYLSMVDAFFPVSTFIIISLLILSIDGSVVFWRIIMWAIKKIPTIN